MTLLLRGATTRDVGALETLLSNRSIRPGERVVVLTDLGAPDGAVVRGAAVVRESALRWLVVAAAVDSRWPPAADALVDQLRAAAIAAGAQTLVFRPGCAVEVLVEVLGRAIVDVGGAATLAL